MNEDQYINLQFEKLLNSDKIIVDFERKWIEKIEKKPGVYIIYINEVIRYVGETGNLHKRMKDLLKTYNHTFRRILGEKLFCDEKDYSKASSSKKYPDAIEKKLDEWICHNCKVSLIPTKIGRKELEEFIQEVMGEQLYNIRKKRI